MTPNEVISIAADKLGDSGFAGINKEQYMTFVNNVANDIWLKAKAAHSIRQYPVAEGERKLTLPDRDIIGFHLIQVRVRDVPADKDESEIYDPTESPEYIREKSPLMDIEEGAGFYRNLGELQAHYHVTPELHEGRYTLHSSTPFRAGTVIQCYVYIQAPRHGWQIIGTGYLTSNYTPTEEEMVAADMESNLIWEPFQNIFITGVTWRAAEQHRTYVQNRELDSLYRDNRNLYFQQYLPDITHYLHSLKDSTAGIQIRPFHFLHEGVGSRLY